MKLAAFNATCPFEIGDKIKIRREIRGELAKRFHLIPATVVEEVHTITDIVCVHSVKNGTVTFMYELDNSGELVRVEMPPAPKAQEPRPAGRGETQNQTDTESGTLPPHSLWGSSNGGSDNGGRKQATT